MAQIGHIDPPSGKLRAALLDEDRKQRSKRAQFVRAAAREPPRRNDLLPRLHLVDRDPRLLTAPQRNVRSLEAAHVKEVAHSISVLGFSVPVVIDGDGNVIDGLVRIEAAKRLGLPTVPCVIAEHLTPQELKLLRLAANRLGERGSWNLPELKLELQELLVEDAPIEITGFELTEIDGILSDRDPAPVEEGPLSPDKGRHAVTQFGDTFSLGPHIVRCGDARDRADLEAVMGQDLAAFVFTDQPYNVPIVGNVTRGSHREFAMASGEMSADEFSAFNEAWISAAAGHLKDGGLLATFIDWRGLGRVTAAALASKLSQVNLVVWAKTNAGMGSLYRSQHELLPVFKKGEAPHVNNVDLGRKGRHRSNVWSYPGASSMGSDARRGLQDHPTVKPAAMLVDALHDLTNRGDIVLDPFLGSGSTLVAAEKSGRICRGIEFDPAYVDLTISRYQKITGKSAVLASSGEPFDVLQERSRGEGIVTVSG